MNVTESAYEFPKNKSIQAAATKSRNTNPITQKQTYSNYIDDKSRKTSKLRHPQYVIFSWVGLLDCNKSFLTGI